MALYLTIDATVADAFYINATGRNPDLCARLEDNLILVEGAVPGPREGYVLISKAKAPPRERRGFAGAATKDALKASKKAAPSKKK